MKLKIHITLIFLTGIFVSCNKQNTINLSGYWHYRLDTAEIGEQEQWYAQSFTKNTLKMPAALRDRNIGFTPTLETVWTGGIYDSSWFYSPDKAQYRKKDSLMFPFWLTPVKRYVGKAWYQKEVSIPKNWEGKNLELALERPHWQTKVWFDSVPIGNGNSLSIPHKFTIPTNNITPGKHIITVCIDNAIRDIDPGINSHSISDHTQGNWNGMVGSMTLESINNISIKRVKITPNINKHTAEIEVLLAGDLPEQAELTIFTKGINHKHSSAPVIGQYKINNSILHATIDMGREYKRWSEFSPNLYQLEIALTEFKETHTEIFGMREFSIKDKLFTINGTPIFLRGTTDCCVFPLTGYPPTDTASWGKIMRICQSYGLNHIRFHSYCPPEAAFIAADHAGIYLQVEGPSWAKYSTTLGDGKPLDQYLMDETKRIIDTYGNHPSFVMMAYGNEPSGHYIEYLENWVDHFRNYDPQRVFTGASTGRSWAIINNSDFIVRSPPRGLEWKNRQPESTFDYNNKTENQNRPYVTFEMGQWCVFPNFKEIDKYTGSLKAKNFELFQDDLENKGMGDLAEDFLMASGKLQTSCYKQEIEATLRTTNLAGFQLLSLNDFSGQGTALVGVLDAFWDEKGYVTANEFKAFCNEVVPLVRLPKYTFTNTETLKAKIEVANFSGEQLIAEPCNWALRNNENDIVASGLLKTEKQINIGHCNEIGQLNLLLSKFIKAEKLSLEVTVGQYTNSWNIWVYPEIQEPIETGNIYITDKLDRKTKQKIEDGENVLLLAAGRVENGKDVAQYFTPVFWNTSWFRMRPPHTTGMLIMHEHPVFNNFPTDYYSDFQWWELTNMQQVMNLDYLPKGFTPIVQPIDTWFINRKLALLFEAKLGKGKVMVCSIDLEKADDSIVSKQLYKSIMEYMNSDSFDPENTLEWETIAELFEEKNREEWTSYVRKKP